MRRSCLISILASVFGGVISKMERAKMCEEGAEQLRFGSVHTTSGWKFYELHLIIRETFFL